LNAGINVQIAKNRFIQLNSLAVINKSDTITTHYITGIKHGKQSRHF